MDGYESVLGGFHTFARLIDMSLIIEGSAGWREGKTGKWDRGWGKPYGYAVQIRRLITLREGSSTSTKTPSSAGGPELVNMTKYKDHRCVPICATGDGGNIRKQLTQEVTRIATNRGCHLRASVYIRSLLLPVMSRIRALELPQLTPSK
jgi:hypothetical protein